MVNYSIKNLIKTEQSVILLEELKLYLRISHDMDDALLKLLIDGAVEYAEKALEIYIAPRTIQLILTQATATFELKCGYVYELLNAEFDIDTECAIADNILSFTHSNWSSCTIECLMFTSVSASIKYALMAHVNLLYDTSFPDIALLEQIYAQHRQIRI